MDSRKLSFDDWWATAHQSVVFEQADTEVIARIVWDAALAQQATYHESDASKAAYLSWTHSRVSANDEENFVAGWNAALAQQAQPQVPIWNSHGDVIGTLTPDEERQVFAQQAQPLTDAELESKTYEVTDHITDNADRSTAAVRVNIALKWARDRMAQQAQPEMPTREKIIETLYPIFRWDRDDNEEFCRQAVRAADAVLALFAPKETT